MLRGFSVELSKIILKFTQKSKKPRITMTILNKKEARGTCPIENVIVAYSRLHNKRQDQNYM